MKQRTRSTSFRRWRRPSRSLRRSRARVRRPLVGSRRADPTGVRRYFHRRSPRTIPSSPHRTVPLDAACAPCLFHTRDCPPDSSDRTPNKRVRGGSARGCEASAASRTKLVRRACRCFARVLPRVLRENARQLRVFFVPPQSLQPLVRTSFRGERLEAACERPRTPARMRGWSRSSHPRRVASSSRELS